MSLERFSLGGFVTLLFLIFGIVNGTSSAKGAMKFYYAVCSPIRLGSFNTSSQSDSIPMNPTYSII